MRASSHASVSRRSVICIVCNVFPSPREGGEKVPSVSEADEGLSRNNHRRRY